jgi:hypothetical protein
MAARPAEARVPESLTPHQPGQAGVRKDRAPGMAGAARQRHQAMKAHDTPGGSGRPRRLLRVVAQYQIFVLVKQMQQRSNR